MRGFILLKHWQLFLLIVITGAWSPPSPMKEVFNSVSIISFSIWINSIVIFGHKKIKQLGLSVFDLKLFKINILFGPIFLIICMVTLSNKVIEPELKFDLLSAFLILLCLYSIFAILYCIYLACKSIALIELRRHVAFGDYFPNLIMIVFFIFGVWILQPKITRLIASE